MTRLPRRYPQRRLPDAGPSSIRYLAVLVVATSTVLAVSVVMPSIGHGFRSGFCGRGDTACSEHAIATDDLGLCRVLSHADMVTDDAVIFTDDLGQSGRLTLSRTVDKQAVVHWFVRQDATAATTGGQLTEFATEDAAREYITAAQHMPVRQRLIDADPTGLVSRLANSIDGHSAVEPRPDAYFVDGGTALDLGNEARSGVGGDLIGGGMTGIAEVKLANSSEPGTTLYVQLSSAAISALGLRSGPSTGLLRSTGLGIASVKFDWTGQPESLVIEAAGELPGRLGPPFGSAGPNLMAGLVSPGPSSDDEQFIGRVSIGIGLTDLSTAAIATGALHALGVPLLLNRRADDTADETLAGPGSSAAVGIDPVERLYELLDAGTADTSVTVNTYRKLPTAASPGAVTLGLQGGLTIADALPAADYYYAPGQGFVQWQTCG